MSGLSFAFGVLAGVILTLVLLVIWVRKSATKDQSESRRFHERANDLLEERNRISRRQLELMEATHASAAAKA